MSVLVLGGDDITHIRGVINAFGCEEVIHWDCRKKSVAHKSIPERVERVVMLTSRLKHNYMTKFKNEAKKKKVPFICAKFDPSSVFYEWVKNFGELPDCDECNSCRKFNH
ncbi:MAG: DUF2325 domain-containing protein [Campylobacterales bacterium]